MKERIFIQKAKERTQLEEFIRNQFSEAKIGSIEVQYTPVVTRVIIHTTTPGLVIGVGGERIKETVEAIKGKFKIDNPQIDVQKILNPDLDPNIIAQTIASAIESKVSYKRLGNYNLQRIMNAGAVGCEIVLSGKFSGQRGRRERFIAGYLKKAGEPAERDVIKGFATATPKLGRVGILVKIMIRQSETALSMKEAQQTAERVVEERETAAREAADAAMELAAGPGPEEEKKAEKKRKPKAKKKPQDVDEQEKLDDDHGDTEEEKAA